MGVDAILDMGRTSINVIGNCLACCVMSRIEGSFRGEEWKEEEEERRRMAFSEQRPPLPVHDNSTSDKRSEDQVPEVVVHQENKQDDEDRLSVIQQSSHI